MIPKFRAFVKPEHLRNGMPEGRLYPVVGLTFYSETQELFRVTVVWNNPKLRGSYCSDLQYEMFDINQVILMQSTGLKDKNGVEGFKDDIVKTGNGRVWIIKHGTYFWHVPGDCIELYGFYLQPIEGEWKGCIPVHEGLGEIIGNIYANPDLLEGNK